MLDATYRRHLASRLWEKGIWFDRDKPFDWTSGRKSPLYVATRPFLEYPYNRMLVVQGFSTTVVQEEIHYDIIAAVANAGISPATTFGDSVGARVVEVYIKPKEHGMQLPIEGLDEEGLGGRKVLVMDNVVSFGGTMACATQIIRDSNGRVDNGLVIFDYSFDHARQVFSCDAPFGDDKSVLDTSITVTPLLTYHDIIDVGLEESYITMDDINFIEEWRKDYLGWVEKYGFMEK